MAGSGAAATGTTATSGRRIGLGALRAPALAVVAALALAGCGSGVPGDRWAAGAPAPAAAAEPGGRLAVTAVDVAFVDVPRRLPPGTYELVLRNAGAQEHEVVLFRAADDLDVVALAAAGPRGPSLVDLAGSTYALPGREGPAALVDLEPGRYTLVCLVPAGDGLPRAARGMQATITVA